MQNGFDFGNTAPAFSESPAGTWLDPRFTADQYKAFLAKAAASLSAAPVPTRELFGMAVTTATRELANQIKTLDEPDELFSLWDRDTGATIEQMRAVFDFCMDQGIATVDGIEFKYSSNWIMEAAGLYVPAVGSLVIRMWDDGNMRVSYTAARSNFFLESYSDGKTPIAMKHTVFRKAYSSQKLAESGKGICTVPTFVFNGREYFNDGISSRGNYVEGEGWSFVPLSDWTGPTYSYHTQLAAWNSGRTERGDRRGLVIRVRGQVCVVDGCETFFDDNPEPINYFLNDGDDAEDDQFDLTDDQIAAGEADICDDEEAQLEEDEGAYA